MSEPAPGKEQTHIPMDEDPSQFGEGLYLVGLFPPDGKSHQLVDIGAYGKELSNTWPLMVRGWKGLLVEMTVSRQEAIRRDFEGLDYTLVCAAAGTQNGVAKLFVHRHATSNSLRPDWRARKCTGDVVDVPVRDVVELLNEHNVPKDVELLCIDSEGLDKQLFEHLFTKSNYRPQYVLTEIESYGTVEELKDFFERFGYEVVRLFGPPVNGLFRRVLCPDQTMQTPTAGTSS